jgi:NAD(P)-dependent dehydrogenase (short-subunit alcohol dehydrogenase family)
MKTAIVTGASGNLGQAVVNKFLAEGYRVVGTVNHNEPAKINLNNPNFEEEAVDLIDELKAKEFVDRVISKYKTIEVAVLTVGGFAAGKIAETGTADVMKQYRLNFETAYNVARPSFVQMIQEDNGRIFIIGSRPGLDAKYGKGMVAYGLGKSLIFRLAELMNDEAKGHNVVTSVVVPSTIDTPQNRKAMPDAKFDSWVKPEAIADVIYFHCTQEAAVMREPLIKVYGNA